MRKPLRVRFLDAIETVLSKMNTTYGWEYSTPTPSDPGLFPGATDGNFLTWFKRVPAARFIAEGIASDCWDKGFRIAPIPDVQSEYVTELFDRLFVPQIVFGHTLSRLFGRSILVLGFNDKPVERWDEPVNWDSARLKYTLALSKDYFDVMTWKFVPSNTISQTPQELLITGLTGLNTLHPDRFLYMEHPDITDLSNHGASVLEPVADLLFESRNVTWSVAQAIWRGAVGMISLFHPKGLADAQKQTVMGNFANVHSRTVNMIPNDWKLQVDGMGKGTIPASKNYEILMRQMSVGSRTPVSVLEGAPRGAFGGSAKDADIHDYYQTISSIQNEYCTPWVNASLQILQRTKQIRLPEKWSVEWNPIYKMSFREKAIDIAGEKLAKKIGDIIEEGEEEKVYEILKFFLSTGGLKP